MRKHTALEAGEAAPDKQVSLIDPDARSMATSGKGTGIVGYNVQIAVDAEHHLIVAHDVTNVGSDRGATRDDGEAGARGDGHARTDGDSRQRLLQRRRGAGLRGDGRYADHSEAANLRRQGDGRFGEADFIYDAREDVYHCPAGEHLTKGNGMSRRGEISTTIARRHAQPAR